MSHVHCRICHGQVLLDPAKMERTADHVALKCPHCDAPVPVRSTDPDRAGPDGIWAIACYTEEPLPEPERTGRFFHRRRQR